MDLHSYAKRKAPKKWSVAQKRKLVETRIAYDCIFTRKSLSCLTTWKKIVSLAKLDDYNVAFVRKQWSQLVDKYKHYKRSRLGSLATSAIDEDLLKKVSREWEFFYPIHTFMSRKITKLHSYALTEGQRQRQSTSSTLTQQQQQEQEESTASLASQLKEMFANNDDSSPDVHPAQSLPTFSSDTNDDYAAAETVASETVSGLDLLEAQRSGNEVTDATADAIQQAQNTQNTDHDFYSKKSPKQKNSLSDESDGAVSMIIIPVALDTEAGPSSKNKLQTECNGAEKNGVDRENKSTNTDVKATQRVSHKSSQCDGEQPSVSYGDNDANDAAGSRTSCKKCKRRRRANERDKYYRHKRRFNRRLECRFDKLLFVFGRVVRLKYPLIDVSTLYDPPPKSPAKGVHEGVFNGTSAEETEISDSSSD